MDERVPADAACKVWCTDKSLYGDHNCHASFNGLNGNVWIVEDD